MPANPYNKYIKQYQTSNITTATPEKLMIMMFDGALQFLQKAKMAIEEKNFQERSLNIEMARKIIREFMRSIDLENGNDVSKSLFKLYNKMAMKLIKANVSRNAVLIDEVIEDLANIRWGFQKAIDIQSGITSVEEVMLEREKTLSPEIPSIESFAAAIPQTAAPQTVVSQNPEPQTVEVQAAEQQSAEVQEKSENEGSQNAG